MSWASFHIDKLKQGEVVQFRPRGNSMKGRIESGSLVTVVPITNPLRKGDIVLCKVRGRDYLHIIKAIKDNQFLIGNNRGGINGWTGRDSIYGLCVNIE